MSCFIKSAAGKTVRYFAFIFFASILQPAIVMDYREEMRNLVREISEYSKNIKNELQSKKINLYHFFNIYDII